MARHNPNTKYGRRKNREEAQRNIENYSDDEKMTYNLFMGCFVFVALIICLIVVAFGGSLK